MSIEMLPVLVVVGAGGFWAVMGLLIHFIGWMIRRRSDIDGSTP